MPSNEAVARFSRMYNEDLTRHIHPYEANSTAWGIGEILGGLGAWAVIGYIIYVVVASLI